MFKDLVSLVSLRISKFKNLRLIESGAFKHLSKTLENLILRDNSIETIEPGAFKCLTNLKYLRLSGNRLTDVQLADLKTNGELSTDVSFSE
jgi:Leucine-rich repeat (LRR) protein